MTGTYLLTWNPENWTWNDLNVDQESIRSSGRLERRWSCGNTKGIAVGSRVFLVRLGPDPRGLIGSGRVHKASFEDAHYDEARAARGDTAFFVGVHFDYLSESPIISMDELQNPPLDQQHWSAQSSGRTLARCNQSHF